MKKSDLKYITSLICNMSGLPVRVYENNELIYFFSQASFEVDPIKKDYDDIILIKSNVGYYINHEFYYYGIINSKNTRIIIGPSRQLKMNRQELNAYAFELGIEAEKKQAFVLSMESLNTMPITSIVQMMCSINFILNNEKINADDVIITSNNEKKPIEDSLPSYDTNSINQHNTYIVEETIKSFIKNGDVLQIKEWTKNAPGVESGKLSNNQLRQLKNTFIVATTLASRAAISGGVIPEDSYALSDLYIQKCELLNDYHSIINLQYNMIVDYAQRVNDLKIIDCNNKIYYDVTNYIIHHLSDNIKVDDIAKALYLNRSYLSSQFKKVTGTSLSKYIYLVKINEAKKMLKTSSSTIEAISNYFGFATHAHFTRVFKEITEFTPSEYQNKK